VDDKYRPADIAEIEQKVSLLNEPLFAPDGTVALPVAPKARPLHAQLCEVLVHTRELLSRPEARGVYVPKDAQREIVRLLYVATRNQVKALAATLECEGLG
jgi:hypothetical protein